MARAILAIAPALACASCNAVFSNLKIENRTGGTITNVTVTFDGKTHKLGDIAPGQSVTFYRALSGEGAPTASFSIGARRINYETCYTTRGSPAHGTISIAPQGVTRRCD